ncbi:hypothetical protein OBBRIDRAFT_835803 [Obba rivulosa]|uniref:Uncharacterized protein n=1 Tax=Obba rivulosa TaxID=1052685 RepID=A0A8E2AWM6_9APHY|nr:hypothetical protein OBBRIDRAFT_835803 [Obba rivulosa]
MSSRSTRGVPAPYSPPALRIFTQTQDPELALRDIEQHRFKQRLHVRKDGNEQIHSDIRLHDHFCLSNTDRKLAYHDALNDIEDAAVGVARTADVLFMGFAVRPEWNPSEPLVPTNININIVLTRHFEQNPAFKDVVKKIRRIVQEELAVPHILAFHSKLNQITPRGYMYDPATHELIENPVRLATSGDAQPADPPSSPSRPMPGRARRPTPGRARTSTNQAEQPRTDSSTEHSCGSAARPVASSPLSRQRPQATSTLSRSALGSSMGLSSVTSRQPLVAPRQTVEPENTQEQRGARTECRRMMAQKTRESNTSNTRETTSASSHTRVVVVPESDSDSERILAQSIQDFTSAMRRDLPPSYEAEYYLQGNIDNLHLPAIVRAYIGSLGLMTHQCARLEAALDYAPDDWIPTFLDIGLNSRDAEHLRRLMEDEMSEEMREVMQSVRGGAGPSGLVSELSSEQSDTESSVTSSRASIVTGVTYVSP